jgi:hypothetical protein
METGHGTTGVGTTGKIANEFNAWPVDAKGVELSNLIRFKFNELYTFLETVIPKANERGLQIVKTKLEEGSMFAVKYATKPVTGN